MKRLKSILILSFLICIPSKTFAFWVVNFGTALTLYPGLIGFAAGIGGQMVFVGQPRTTNAFFTIPHSGFRIGLTQKLDAGLRLAPVPLPFSSVGPAFGINLDVKYHLTDIGKVKFALIGGLGGAHILLQSEDKFAWSPNAAVLSTFPLKNEAALTVMGRYVNLMIPTAAEGARNNYVNIYGISVGLKKDLTSSVSILPEAGVYWYDGQIEGTATSGPGFQYGIMLATTF